MLIRGTAKFLKFVGATPRPISPDGMRDPLEQWYANLLWFDRRKCVLMTNAVTLFSFLVADVRKADLVPIGDFAVHNIEREVASEGLPRAVFGALDASRVQLDKTADRSVLGTMNDLAFQCEHAMHGAGGLVRTDIAALNRWLRQIPFSAIGYKTPIDLARSLLAPP